MRDAFGGVTSLVIIVVFLVLVSGYLAFNVNYTKAFKVKNKIITLFEQYEGKCGKGDTSTSACDDKITEYVNRIGHYNPNMPTDFYATGFECPGAGTTCSDSGCSPSGGYCWLRVDVPTPSDVEKKAYYKIVTQINMNIPIINNIMPGLKIFQISGDTRTIIVAE